MSDHWLSEMMAGVRINRLQAVSLRVVVSKLVEYGRFIEEWWHECSNIMAVGISSGTLGTHERA